MRLLYFKTINKLSIQSNYQSVTEDESCERALRIFEREKIRSVIVFYLSGNFCQ